MSRTTRHALAAFTAALLLAPPAALRAAEPTSDGRQLPAADLLKAEPEAIEAWKDMRFGMFICWGPVSLTEREIGWSRGKPTPIEEYDNLYKKWNPDKFDARQWVKIAKDSGARYIVFLLKHHDGFCLLDTKQTDHNIMNGPFRRDVAKEIAAACREQGIGFFPYYSTCDWHHPDFPLTSPGGKVRRPVSNLDRYNDYLEAQAKELITGYGPLVGIWFDVPQCFDRARGERVIRFARSLQPDILVNNRTGAPGDFDTPEQKIGSFNMTRPWESCMTVSRRSQWTWGGADDGVKSHQACLEMLLRCAGGDGNMVLNVGPRPDGIIDPEQANRLKEIGVWLRKYGESIYGTRGGPYTPGRNVTSTRKGKVVYLHILNWPATGDLRLPALPAQINSATLLTGGNVQVTPEGSDLVVKVAPEHRQAIDTLVKLELDKPASGIAPIKLPEPEAPAQKKRVKK
jgi:alpha-L-fucosidase